MLFIFNNKLHSPKLITEDILLSLVKTKKKEFLLPFSARRFLLGLGCFKIAGGEERLWPRYSAACSLQQNQPEKPAQGGWGKELIRKKRIGEVGSIAKHAGTQRGLESVHARGQRRGSGGRSD